jgi:hypothetical protein
MKFICNARFDNGTKNDEGKSIDFEFGQTYVGKDDEKEIERLLKQGLILSEEDFKIAVRKDIKGFSGLTRIIDELQKENAQLRSQIGDKSNEVPALPKVDDSELNPELFALREKSKDELMGIARQLGIEVNKRQSKDELIDLILKADTQDEEKEDKQ